MAGRDLQAALHGYEILEELGSGAAATVYLARDVSDDRRVAIKVLRSELSSTHNIRRFLREIEFLSDLDHPNILPLLDCGDSDGIQYYVMPFIEGESLRERLKREKMLGVDDAISITTDIAAGLEYAQARGIVHRDIKPSNILLAAGHAVISDFGIAHALGSASSQRLTQPGVALGTPLYMSPEQGGSDGWVDARGDIYSLGCVTYEMLTGSPPFNGPTPQVIMARHSLDEPPPIRTIRKTVSPFVEAAVNKALAKLPSDRFETAAELIEALDSKNWTPAPPSGRWRSLHWIGVAGVALLALVIGISLRTLLTRAPLDRNRIVVFPLTGQSPAERVSGDGWGIAIAIEMGLEHTEPLRWYDGWERLSEPSRSDPLLVTADTTLDLSRRLGAGYYISGSFGRDGDELFVSLQLYDAQGDSLLARESARGDASISTLPQLGLRAVAGLIPPLVDPGRAIDLTPLSDRDPGAIALWIQGERAYRGSQFDRAVEIYERAVAQDSLLVLAALKGAQAANWRSKGERAEALLAVASANEAILPERYRHLARGLRYYIEGSADSAVSEYTMALEAAPDWSEAAMVLGEVYYHLLPTGSQLDSTATMWFTRAFELDSSFTPPLVHLTDVALRAGDARRAERLIRRLDAENTDVRTLDRLNLMLQCIVRSPRNFRWADAVARDTIAVVLAAQALSVSGAQLECAENGFRALLEHDDAVGWGELIGLQAILLAQGRVAEAEAVLDSARSSNTGAYSLYLFNAVAGGWMEEKAAYTESLGQSTGEDYAAAQPLSRWLLGLWQVRLGNLERAARISRTFSNDTSTEQGSPADMAISLNAHIAAAAGDTARALALLESLSPSAHYDELVWDLFPGLALDKLLLAELFMQQERYAEALEVASVFDQQPVPYLILLRRSLQIRASTAGELGRPELQRRHLARLAALDR